jgi:hypothetical protein
MWDADCWSLACAGGEFDGARRIGDCRRGRMLSGKASDVHVNVETELNTWPRGHATEWRKP